MWLFSANFSPAEKGKNLHPSSHNASTAPGRCASACPSPQQTWSALSWRCLSPCCPQRLWSQSSALSLHLTPDLQWKQCLTSAMVTVVWETCQNRFYDHCRHKKQSKQILCSLQTHETHQNRFYVHCRHKKHSKQILCSLQTQQMDKTDSMLTLVTRNSQHSKVCACSLLRRF